MIGICCVYLANTPMQYDILRLSIRQIKRTTKGPYRIYGSVPGQDPETLDAIAELGITVVAAPTERLKLVQREHTQLLDALINKAIADGCTHIATFDMDSWPIETGWDQRLSPLLRRSTPMVAMVRTEFKDNFPFLAFTYFRAKFWKPNVSSVGIGDDANWSEAARTCSTRPGETGSGLLAQLYDDKRRLFYFERSNVWNPHPVLAGVYGNCVFHLGAMSRNPVFKTDSQIYQLGGAPEKRQFATHMNRAAQRFFAKALTEDHDATISALTEDEAPLEPTKVARKGFSDIPKTASVPGPGASSKAPRTRRRSEIGRLFNRR